MPFRKIIFWAHLVCGLLAGVVIAIMSFTGAVLAFENEIVAWAERDVRRVEIPAPDAPHLPLAELQRKVREANPEARPSGITVTSDPRDAVVFTVGRDGNFYVNPYTGDVRTPATTRMHDFMHVMEDWHRVLARKGENRAIGKVITGACNAAFLGLAVTGLYIWWPRKWGWRLVKPSLWFVKAKGKYREWNWHNVFGFWSLPVLIVLTATGMVMSYRWAGNLLYTVVGEQAPVQGGGPGGGVGAPAMPVPAPAPGARPLGLNALLSATQKQIPDWETITLRTGGAGGQRRGPGASQGSSQGATGTPATPRAEGERARPAQAEDTARPAVGGEGRGGRANPQPATPVTVSVKVPGTWPRTATTTLTLNPYTGETMKTETFADGTPGRKLRTWARFLHTGQALGLVGQFVAGLACLGGCMLVYTGFALSYRRFFGKKKKLAAA